MVENTKKIIAGLVVLTSISAQAAVQTVTANIGFIAPLSITNVVNANLGMVTAGVASTKYVLATDGTVTVATGPGSVVTGATSAASLKISGSNTQAISIVAGNYVASNGVTPSAVTCKYGSASAVACDSAIVVAAPGVAGTTLTMGLSVTTAGNEASGATATPSFNMTILYN